jgi:hypothetical protein
MGLYSFTLPHTPPPAKGKKLSAREILGLDALVLLKRPAFLTFIICSFLICIPLAFYYQLASKFVDAAGQANTAFKMSFGQMSEIFFMLVMPLFFARLGVKWMLFVGMLAWVVRYGLFAAAADDGIAWMVLGGIVLHGICYDFFFVTGQIYTDKVAPPAIRSQAQGLLVLFTLGFGMLIGAQAAGFVEGRYTLPEEKKLAAEKEAEAIAAQMAVADAGIETILGPDRNYFQRLLGLSATELTTTQKDRIAALRQQIEELREQRSDVLLDVVQWRYVWGIPAVFAAAIMLVFALIFREGVTKKEPLDDAGEGKPALDNAGPA